MDLSTEADLLRRCPAAGAAESVTAIVNRQKKKNNYGKGELNFDTGKRNTETRSVYSRILSGIAGDGDLVEMVRVARAE